MHRGLIWALTIAMLLHELGTNAVKYGALSTDAGHVSLIWTVEPDGERRRLSLTWTEVGGPKVEPPTAFVEAPARGGLHQRVVVAADQRRGRREQRRAAIARILENLKNNVDIMLLDPVPDGRAHRHPRPSPVRLTMRP